VEYVVNIIQLCGLLVFSMSLVCHHSEIGMDHMAFALLLDCIQ